MRLMEQVNLFDFGKERYKITKPIRLIELFAGIGSQAKSLKNLGVEFEHYRICEFDKYAVASYNAVHGTNFEVSDITQLKAEDLGIVDTDKYTYILTYSFPCTDLSLAGKMAGMGRESGTRSGLLWEVERLLKECVELNGNLPEVLLMENVPQVHSEGDNMRNFMEWVQFLNSLGYESYWQDMNAKDYGIPQNRNRTFMVSLLGNYTYKFPEAIPLKLRLKDMLEDNVNEKYYLSQQMLGYINSHDDKYKVNDQNLVINRDVACTKSTREGSTRADASDFICDGVDNNLNIANMMLTERESRSNLEKYVMSEKATAKLLSIGDEKHQPTILDDESDVAKSITTRVGAGCHFEQYVKYDETIT